MRITEEIINASMERIELHCHTKHEQQLDGLNIALQSLTDLEMEILIDRFRGGKTLQECADQRSFTRQYIQHIEQGALKKLKHPTRAALISYGPDAVKRYESLQVEIEMMEKRAAELQAEIFKSEKDLKDSLKQPGKVDIALKKGWATITLDDMGLSTRVKYSLGHKNIYNLYQLSQLTRKELMGIRLLGAVTVKEIIEKAAQYGVQILDGE